MKNIFWIILIAMSLLFSKGLYAQKAYMSSKYSGTIGSNKIALEMVEGDKWMGDYYYVKHKQKIEFTSDKMIPDEGKKIILNESVNNKKTGYFVFTEIDLDKPSLNGTWYSADGSKSYPVKLTKSK